MFQGTYSRAVSSKSSPGLRRKLRASELRSRPKTAQYGTSSFYTCDAACSPNESPTLLTQSLLTQPRSFTPPLAATQDHSDSDNASLGLSTFYAPSVTDTSHDTSVDSMGHERRSGDSTPEDREPMYV